MQKITFGAFVHLESGIYDHIGVLPGQPDNFVADLVMEEFLVRFFVFLVRLRSDQVPVPLLEILLIFAMLAFI
jgi:hypothetical protein